METEWYFPLSHQTASSCRGVKLDDLILVGFKMNRQVPIMICKWHLHTTPAVTQSCVYMNVNRNSVGERGHTYEFRGADDFSPRSEQLNSKASPLLLSMYSKLRACSAAQEGEQAAIQGVTHVTAACY